jgi:hypothetical protein
MNVKHFGCFDLHSNNAVGVIIDQDKKWVLKRKFINDLPVILQALEKYRETLVGIEKRGRCMSL